MNKCSPCGLDFSSTAYFDAHRVGKHAHTFAEGLRMEPMREDGRRCLTEAEMLKRGWSQNARGQWRKDTRQFDSKALARLGRA